MDFKTDVLVLAIVGLLAVGVSAAPSADIRTPPVVQAVPWTGPVHDPAARQGQWFLDLITGQEEARAYEFYDNETNGHGGGFMGHRAIDGILANVQFAPGTIDIIAFDIIATITNDLPSPYIDWRSGENDHSETMPWEGYEIRRDNMYNVKLTAEFAIDAVTGFPAEPAGYPYRKITPNIIAVNHDQLAWYCWTPENPIDDFWNWGTYYVPTWDFGDIPMGQAATRTLSFIVDGHGLRDPDLRWFDLWEALDSVPMVPLLLNRTASLKISNWVDDPGLDRDPVQANPEPPMRSSDCSVFYEPEDRIEFAVDLELDWVYQNTPLTMSNLGHTSVLTVNVLDYAGNSSLTITVAKVPASGPGEVTVQNDPGSDPLKKYIYGSMRTDGMANTGPLTLRVTATGDVSGVATVDVPFTCRQLGDCDGNGAPEPGDVTVLIMKLNGIPPAGYHPKAFDLDANGAAEPGDVQMLINVLNGLPVP